MPAPCHAWSSVVPGVEVRWPVDPSKFDILQNTGYQWARRNKVRLSISHVPPNMVVRRLDGAVPAHIAAVSPPAPGDPPASLLEAVGVVVPLAPDRSGDLLQGHCPFCRAVGESLVVAGDHWECSACGLAGTGPGSWVDAVARSSHVSPMRSAADAVRHRGLVLAARLGAAGP